MSDSSNLEGGESDSSKEVMTRHRIDFCEKSFYVLLDALDKESLHSWLTSRAMDPATEVTFKNQTEPRVPRKSITAIIASIANASAGTKRIDASDTANVSPPASQIPEKVSSLIDIDASPSPTAIPERRMTRQYTQTLKSQLRLQNLDSKDSLFGNCHGRHPSPPATKDSEKEKSQQIPCSTTAKPLDPADKEVK